MARLDTREHGLHGPGTQQDKAVATACAVAALNGVLATPSHDDRGRRTLVLSHGAWVREVLPEQLAEALAELRALQREAATA